MQYSINEFRYRKHELNRFKRFLAREFAKFLKD
jgi:hypothetical protein